MRQPRPAAESACYTASTYRTMLESIGVVVSYTVGVSMRPLIFSGIGFVAIVPVEKPQIGDVLLFEQIRRGATACILHRLVAIEGDVLITRGDNCLACERLLMQDVIGRVEKVYWSTYGRNPLSPHFWLPRLFKAEMDQKSYCITVRDPRYLRYVDFWNAIWPLRSVVYRLRAVAAKVYHLIFKRKTPSN